ncbi:MAG: hypothetical protein HRU15_06585, partial [Planctomycetes bacterium]|nr:hypothetical protein [Planctomycetota bacterium]
MEKVLPAKNAFIELNRIFFERDMSQIDSSEDKYFLQSFMRHSSEVTWEVLEEKYAVMILGESGSGKTFELEARCNLKLKAGKRAWFIPLKELSNRGLQYNSIESEIDEWMEGPTDIAYFYLDSLDEAKLNQQTLESALSNLYNKIKDVLSMVRIILSSRPMDINLSDIRTLKTHKLFQINMRTTAPSVDDLTGSNNQEKEVENIEAHIEFYEFFPLEKSQVMKLAEHRDIDAPDAFMEKLTEQNLLDMAGRPQDVV